MRAAFCSKLPALGARSANFHPCQSSLHLKPSCSSRRDHTYELRAQPSDQQGTDVETPLVSALTTIGLSGTIAVTGASLCGIQLFNLFQWSDSDIVLALELNSALLVLGLLLFAPRWEIPQALSLEPVLSKQQSHSQSQLRLINLPAVKAGGKSNPVTWQLMLALYKSALQRPQTDSLPVLVSKQ